MNFGAKIVVFLHKVGGYVGGTVEVDGRSILQLLHCSNIIS
jgi:hypothetical protein